MISLKQALASSLGKKFVMSLSGLVLLVFIIVHLLGNLSLYLPAEQAGPRFNQYGAYLENMGWLRVGLEVLLAAAFVIHISYAIRITLINKAARQQPYLMGIVSKGGPSHLSILSKNMIVSGVMIGIFLVVHLWQFRFSKYVTELVALNDGGKGYDLYTLVAQTFSEPINVIFYTLAILLLGAHLSHGVWSALQSLGAMRRDFTKQIHGLGVMIALILAAGFLFIPLLIFLKSMK